MWLFSRLPIMLCLQEQIKKATATISKQELEERVRYFKGEDKLLEAQRIAERTNFDIEMLQRNGILFRVSKTIRDIWQDLRPGQPPYTLMDYFPDDFLIIIDESHKTIPQIRGMYRGRPVQKDNAGGLWLPSAVCEG